MLRVVLEGSRRRRDRLEILALMLRVATDGANKTQIMCAAKLNFAQSTKYLSSLLRLRFLETSKKDKKLIYKTLDKGKLYVKEYEGMRDLLNT